MLLVFFVASGVAIKFWYGTPRGRMAIDGMLLKAPVVGNVLRKIAVARFTRTLGTPGISSGRAPFWKGWTLRRAPREMRWWEQAHRA